MLEKASHSLQEQEQEEQGMMLILKSKLKKKIFGESMRQQDRSAQMVREAGKRAASTGWGRSWGLEDYEAEGEEHREFKGSRSEGHVKWI